jgi:tRNA wybutosine-synthesizing protein 2
VAGQLPRGYQRLGSILLLRLPETLRPYGPEIGRWYREELGVEAVLAVEGGVEGEYRRPRTACLAGTSTEVLHREEGILWRLDPAEIMFAAGNRRERQRLVQEVRPGEEIADLFAGIGYFTLPLARSGRPWRVWAVEKNPLSYGYLQKNLELNALSDRVVALQGDNREVALPAGTFDRVLLGFLPDSRPFLPRAQELLRPEGGWCHVHLVVNARHAEEESLAKVRDAVREGRDILDAQVHRVKPYGPAREHTVVDVRMGPR